MTRILSAALAAMLALSLAACGDDDPKPKFEDPPTTPSTPTSPTPGPTDPPTPTEPPLPDAATKDTKAGAIAFTKYYWALTDYAQATGDTSPLKKIGLKDCAACNGGIEFVDKVFKAGGVIHGGEVTVEPNGAALIEIGTARGYRVALLLISKRQRIDYPGDKKDEVFPAGRAGMQFLVRRDAAGWRVVQWELT